jgi:predicted nuclease with TOPRIM domain
MRIGSVLIFLVLTWIGLGFLLSDDINTHKSLDQIQTQVDTLTREKKAIQDQLNEAVSELQALREQNNQLSLQITFLQSQIEQTQEANKVLSSQNGDLQTQLEEAKNLNAFIHELMNIPPRSVMLAILIPVLPASLFTTVVIHQYKQRRKSNKPDQPVNPKRKMSVQVSEDEMQRIIKTRRGKQ